MDSPTSRAAALFLSAFFDELIRCGVREIVLSPGSRSTPLALVAYASELEMYVDVDERGAAFFALGLAKASRRPVCMVCTSGTAAANYLPALLEARASRVPLIVLTADRPPRLQNLGAPQTCDQVKLFGDAVLHFQQMPLPGTSEADVAFARQMALTAVYRSAEGAVHFNFPFDDPLMPDLSVDGLFSVGRSKLDVQERRNKFTVQSSLQQSGPLQRKEGRLSHRREGGFLPQPLVRIDECAVDAVMRSMSGKRGIVLCGEGSFRGTDEAEALLAWAERYHLPLIADPLSNLRQYEHPCVIDVYEGLFNTPECPAFDYLIRFGRYPVAQSCSASVAKERPLQIVVDSLETRDFNSSTDLFVQASPADFVASFATSAFLAEAFDVGDFDASAQKDCLKEWTQENEKKRIRAASVVEEKQGFEGAFVYRLLQLAPAGSLVFSGNSMAIRMIDAFYLKQDKALTCLCNRGLNGIDGTNSTAFGAAQHFEQTTYFTGDLAFLHDLNALALQQEIREQHATRVGSPMQEGHSRLSVPCIVVVLFNNGGGGIFELLPQQSEDAYFERIFTTPQKVDFSRIAQGFEVPYHHAVAVEEAARIYASILGTPGISILEVKVSRAILKQAWKRYH